MEDFGHFLVGCYFEVRRGKCRRGVRLEGVQEYSKVNGAENLPCYWERYGGGERGPMWEVNIH